ncbi:MAG: ComEC/Rec2 family competence protein [Tepidisphaeraceae bacterium]
MADATGEIGRWSNGVARRPAVVAAAVFIGGIAVHRLLPHVPLIWIISAMLAAVSAAALFDWPKGCGLAVLAAMLFAGVGAAQIESFYFRDDTIAAYASDDPRLARLELEIVQPLRIVGTHFNTARPMPPKQVTTAQVVRVMTTSGWRKASGDILLQTDPPSDRLAIGQRVRVLGMLQRPGGAMNPGQFDWAGYYREQRVLTSIHVPHSQAIEIVASRPPSLLARGRESVRRILGAGFTAARSLDHALLRALVLGDNDPELRDVQEQFRRTGTSHHLAISGMHVAVLGGVIYWLCHLILLRTRAVAWIAMGAVIVYGALALPSPPVIRSVILCASFALGILARRTTDGIQLLGVSVLVMLVYQPLDLYGAGFQLSFGTVLGLMVLTRRIEPLLRDRDADVALAAAQFSRPIESLRVRQRLRNWLAAPIAAAVIAWLVSLPLVAFHFEQLNPWAVIASLLLAPVVFIALIGGFLKILLTALLPFASGTWATLAAAPVSWMRHMVDWLAKLPGSEVPLPGKSISFIAIYYALLCLPLLPMSRPRVRLTLKFSPALAVLLFALIPLGGAGAMPSSGALRVTVLAVGAGQCCVIETPDGRTILLDAGSITLADPVRRCIAPFLRNRGIASIDELWLSHSDYDHLSAAADLIDGYDVERVVVSDEFHRHASATPAAEGVLATVSRVGARLDSLSRERRIELGEGVTIDVLWPPGDSAFDSNDSGLVLKLTYARRTILFPADIEEPAQRALLRQSPAALACDVLLAPHHGSTEASTAAFVAAADPLFVISSNDRTLSQRQRQFERLIGSRELLRTNRCGAIIILIERDGGLTVTPYVKSGGR